MLPQHASIALTCLQQTLCLHAHFSRLPSAGSRQLGKLMGTAKGIVQATNMNLQGTS